MYMSFIGKAVILALACTAMAPAGDMAAVIRLPKPSTSGGMPLMRALAERKSTREFSAEKLPLQVVSNLLWAAYGVNRPDGRRTAPSAMNEQTIDIYVTLPEGAYLYQARDHRLNLVAPGDFRSAAGRQSFVAEAALNLVYVADTAKLASASADDKLLYTGAETGFVSQNVYLFCASEGLATVVRAMVDRPALAKILKLRPEQRITLSQTVGYPKPAR
jgi:SagB-type dehydrogenase family enzyme